MTPNGYTITSFYQAVIQMIGHAPNKWTAFGQGGEKFTFWYTNDIPPEVRTAIVLRWPQAEFIENKEMTQLQIPAKMTVTVTETVS